MYCLSVKLRKRRSASRLLTLTAALFLSAAFTTCHNDGGGSTNEGSTNGGSTNGAFWDGSSDTSWYNDTAVEFKLQTAAQLAGLAQIVNGTASGIGKDDFKNKTIFLENDLYLNEVLYSSQDNTNTANNWTEIGQVPESNQVTESMDRSNWTAFAGTFDGQGHTVHNLYNFNGTDYSDASNAYLGLFGYLTGTVKYLGVTGYVEAGRMGAGLAAYNNGIIIGCFNGCTVRGNGSGSRPSGGLTALNDGIIAYCYNSANIKNGSTCEGGLAGNTKYTGSLIFSSFNTGKMANPVGWAGAVAASDCEAMQTPLGKIFNCYWLDSSNGDIEDRRAVCSGYSADTLAYRFRPDGTIDKKQVNSSYFDVPESGDPATLLEGINVARSWFISEGGMFKLFWQSKSFNGSFNDWEARGTVLKGEAVSNLTLYLSCEGYAAGCTVITATATPKASYKIVSFTLSYGNGRVLTVPVPNGAEWTDSSIRFLVEAGETITVTASAASI